MARRSGTENLGERHVRIVRDTKETKVALELDLDSCGLSRISTGLPFFDHMLEQIPNHGGVSLAIEAKGDLQVDEHHTIEDVGIVLGEAIGAALGDKLGMARYGFVLPMDDCDAAVLLDFGGRIDFRWNAEFKREKVGDVPTEMFSHFFQSVSSGARCNLHIRAEGGNDHHKAEAIFKAFARALRMAVAKTPFPYELPSSKGIL
uniref:imidazoleglycerol-phosphate dehydratase HisB n=1 Tax=Candidatus Cryptobacteroides bacterium TaxID=3085639 RepID=UPI004026AD98